MSFGKGKIWFDGKFVDWQDARIHLMSHVVHYGSSIFESMRCYNAENGPAIFRIDAHIDRLYDSAKIYRMKIPFSKKEFSDAVINVVKKNNFKECYIRPVVFRGYGEIGVNPLKNPVNCAIAAWEWGAYLGKEAMEKGASVIVSSWRRAAPDTFPSLAKAGGNYINSQLIKMDAVQGGYDEAIALDVYGYVSEASGENIFIVKNGVIFTPPTSSSILAGITRHTVFTLARDMNIRVEQHSVPRESLYIADEVFLTGTAAEITPVSKIDNIIIGKGNCGEITKKLQTEYFNILRGKTKDKYNWLTYVK
ncbi:MAG: branched chain amino acid aminotransferase [Elusimicrobia bacterium HGW-Elusimicrobia-4]|nr:MAG: branched chain amino acid aminotransferase [Elusimicrobia bacterium HGW-Elusimicrobia-4]